MGEIHATELELLGEAAAVGNEAVTTSFSDSWPVVTDDPARTSLPRSSSSIQLPAVAAEDQVFVPSDPGSGFDHLGDIQRSHARIGGEAATDDPFPSFGSLTSFADLSSFQRSSTLAIAAKVEAFEQPGSTAQDFSPVGVVAATLVPAVAAKDQAFGASSSGSGLRGIQSHAAISGEAAAGDYGPVATDDPTSLSASDSNVQVWEATQDFSLGEIADAIVRNYFDGKLPRDSARPAEAIMRNYFDGTPSWDSDRAQVSPVRMTPASLGDLYGRLEFYQTVRVAQAVEMVAHSFGDFHKYRSWHPWAFEEAHQFSRHDDPTMVEVENQFSWAEGELPRDDDNDTVSSEGDLHMEEEGEEDEHAVIEVEDQAAREEEKDHEAGEEDDVDKDEFAQIEEGPRVDDAQCDGLESKDDEAVEIQVLAHQFPRDDDPAEIQISWDEAVQELLRDGTERSEGMEEVREDDEHAVIEAEDHAAREEGEDNKAGEADDVDEDEFAQIEEDARVDNAQCDGLESENDEAAEIQVLAHQFPQGDDLAEIQISWDEAMQELVRDSTASLEGMEELRQEDEHAVIEADDHAMREEEEEEEEEEEDEDVVVDEDFSQIEEYDPGVDDDQCDRLKSEDDEAEVDNWIVEPKEDKGPTGGAAVPDLDEQAKDDYLVAVPYQTLEPVDQLVAVAVRDPSMDEESNDDDLVVAANAASVPDPEAPAAVEPDFYEQFSPDFWTLPRSYDQFLDNLFLQTTLLFDLMY
ncbi:uncharacterized protein LOC112342168 isoform X2 [Selaginella moellendorffii]|nr:uncharacterized protein LOC112342168 isoform X2 [Selaginella moellendorffii]|eukprot:XP_024519328.1 uncharacterized protein LOC112342168 isoform X2 [Selaginella moellendorffii]